MKPKLTLRDLFWLVRPTHATAFVNGLIAASLAWFCNCPGIAAFMLVACLSIPIRWWLWDGFVN